ncbi:unnamed protein product [Phytomonas sp. Hart1]|nr:unnamed protein product [Phytomonas sp. Hart1]|eukprot:CCW66370.1 unnamed protein product [Phytomonas sp. isolate Hart1]
MSRGPKLEVHLTLWDVFYETHWRRFWEGCYDYLCHLVMRCYCGNKGECPSAADPLIHYSILITGEPGCGKRALVSYFAHRIPHLIEVSLEFGQVQRTVHYVVERRSLDLAEVLTQDEEEGIQIVRTALRPPLYDTKGTLKPLLLLCLYNFDLLLQSSGNPLTDLLSYELSVSLDELNASETAVVIWSTSQDPSLEVRPLNHRLSFNQIYLTKPTSAERMTCLRSKLESLNVSQAGDSGKILPIFKQDMNEKEWNELLQSLNETLASFSTPALVALKVSDLVERLLEISSESAQDGIREGKSLSSYNGLINMDDIITKLEELVVWPLMHLKTLQAFHIPCAKGVLVCGPSGSGKTVLLNALGRRLCDVRSLHVMFINGLSLIEKEVGKSEKNIAAMFATARAHSPTALFLHNLDGLAPPRCRQSSETTTATDRTLSTLLTEMDGVGGDTNCVVMIIASTSSLESLDPAVRRPGRLDVHVTLDPLNLEGAVDAIVSRLSSFCAELRRKQLRCGHSATYIKGETHGDYDGIHDGQFEARIERIITQKSQKLFEARSTYRGAELSVAVVMATAREIMLFVLESLVTSIPFFQETALPIQIVEDKLAECMEAAFAKLLSPSRV